MAGLLTCPPKRSEGGSFASASASASKSAAVRARPGRQTTGSADALRRPWQSACSRRPSGAEMKMEVGASGMSTIGRLIPPPFTGEGRRAKRAGVGVWRSNPTRLRVRFAHSEPPSPFRGGIHGEAGRVGASFNEHSVNCFQDSLQILIDLAVPKTKNMKAGAAQFSIPRLVACSMRINVVLPAIDFDNKAMLQTYEVNDIAATWRLTTKMKSLLSPRTKVIPDFHLLRRQRLS